MNTTLKTCLWCGAEFSVRRRRGNEQRFCSASHRNAFWTAARRWAFEAIESGLVSIETLKASR